MFPNLNLLRSCSRLLVVTDKLWPFRITLKVTSDKVYRLFVTPDRFGRISYFRPDRFVQVLSLIPILILLLYLLVSIDLLYTGL